MVDIAFIILVTNGQSKFLPPFVFIVMLVGWGCQRDISLGFIDNGRTWFVYTTKSVNDNNYCDTWIIGKHKLCCSMLSWHGALVQHNVVVYELPLLY